MRTIDGKHQDMSEGRRYWRAKANKHLRQVAVAVREALQAGAAVSDVWKEVGRGARLADFEYMAQSADAAADASTRVE